MQLPCDCKKEGDGMGRGNKLDISYFIVSHLLPDLKDISIPPDLGASCQHERLFPTWTVTLEAQHAPPTISKSQGGGVYRARARKMTVNWSFLFCIKFIF